MTRMWWVTYTKRNGHDTFMPVCSEHLKHLLSELERTKQPVKKVEELTRQECNKWYSCDGALDVCWQGKSHCKNRLEQ